MPNELRVIIAGSRSFNDYTLLKKEVIKALQLHNATRDNIIIISGGARGADILGERFANEFNIRITKFIPDWNGLGKRAGYVRNEEMAKYAVENDAKGILIAFWDGISKGTNHMINLAKKHGLEIHIISFKK